MLGRLVGVAFGPLFHTATPPRACRLPRELLRGGYVFWGAPGFAAGRPTTITLVLAGFGPAVEIDAGPIILLSDLTWGINPQRMSFFARAWEAALPQFPPRCRNVSAPFHFRFFCIQD